MSETQHKRIRTERAAPRHRHAVQSSVRVARLPISPSPVDPDLPGTVDEDVGCPRPAQQRLQRPAPLISACSASVTASAVVSPSTPRSRRSSPATCGGVGAGSAGRQARPYALDQGRVGQQRQDPSPLGSRHLLVGQQGGEKGRAERRQRPQPAPGGRLGGLPVKRRGAARHSAARVPSRTMLNSSSFVCRCIGAAIDRGASRCSTRPTRPPKSSESTRNRSRQPAGGPRTSPAPLLMTCAMPHDALLHDPGGASATTTAGGGAVQLQA